MPRTRDEIIERLSRSTQVLENLFTTLEFTIDNFKKYLVSIQQHNSYNGYSLLKIYDMYLRKQKSV